MRVDRALKFYREVLGLPYLHYGLWSEGDPPTLEGLAAAQRRYAERLCELVPAGVEAILDAGCGTGGNARLLSSRGYRVEGLSPDPYQRQVFSAETGLPFHLVRFQDFDPPHAYDLVLMSESCQYVPPAELFAAARRAAPGGHLLISDYFTTVKDGTRLTKSGHLLPAFREAAERAGFEPLTEEDVTERVLPTLDLARRLGEGYILPALRFAGEEIAERHPWLHRLARPWASKRLAKLEAQRVLLDSEAFARVKRYLFLLYRVPA